MHEESELRRFLYTRHDDVKAILRDKAFWSDPRNANPGTFTPAAVERWRPCLREVVERVLDAIAGEEFDFIGDLAGPVPTVVIAEMLGIDPERHGDGRGRHVLPPG